MRFDIPNLEELINLTIGHRFNYTDEAELQAGIATMLNDAGVSFIREVTLSRQDRIDFLIGDIGIEVKVGGSLAAVTRQVDDIARETTRTVESS